MAANKNTPAQKNLPRYPWIGKKRPFYGWVIVFVGAVTQFTQGVINQGYSTYLSHLKTEFGWSTTILAGPRSIMQVENSILGPIEGFLVDKLGPRIMVLIGTFFMGAGLILFGMSHSVWMYYLSNIIIAIGTGFQGILIMSVVINHWFLRKRTIAQSFMLTGYAIAGVIGVPVLVSMQTAFGWRTAAIVTGIFAWIVGFPSAMYLFRRPEPFGLLPDGDTAETAAKRKSISGYDYSLKEALRTPAFWLLGLCNAMGMFGMSSVQTHVFLHLEEGVKLAPAAAALVWSIASISNIPSRLIAGYIGDKKPKYIVLGIGTAVMGISLFVLGIANSMFLAIIFAVIYGIGWGARTPVMNAIQGDYFGNKSQGIIRGWLAIISLPFAIVAPVLTGYLNDINGNYRLAFIIASIIGIAGGVMAMFAVPPKPPKPWETGDHPGLK